MFHLLQQKKMFDVLDKKRVVNKEVDKNIINNKRQKKQKKQNSLNIKIIKNFNKQQIKCIMDIIGRKYLFTCYSTQISKNKMGSIRQLGIEQYNIYDQYLVINNPNVRIFCDGCFKNITIICHINYQEYDYCIGCFIQCQKFPQQYHVRSSLMYSLTDQQWLVLDQILLLTAFQKWGFGNWGQVKDYMSFNGAKFTKNQIEYHYDKYYLLNQQINNKIISSLLDELKKSSIKQAKRFKPYLTKKQSKQSLLDIKNQQISNISIKKNNISNQQNILGYNLKRKCFYYDLQYDQKAQSMLADLEFKDDDTEEQIQFKFRIIDNYNRRLEQRVKRYDFTIEHHILDIDYRFKQQFSTNKYKKQAFTLYRPFTRFQNHKESQEIMQLIARNNYYKSLIQGLKKCRKKIDKQGKISNTIQYLCQKEDTIEKLGNPRKVYQICVMDDHKMDNEEEVLGKLTEILKKSEEGETNHNLKILQNNQIM